MGNSRVVDQVPDLEGLGSAQGDKQVQGGDQLAEFNALDGGLLHVGDVSQPLLRVAAGLAQQPEPVGKHLETGRIFHKARWRHERGLLWAYSPLIAPAVVSLRLLQSFSRLLRSLLPHLFKQTGQIVRGNITSITHKNQRFTDG